MNYPPGSAPPPPGNPYGQNWGQPQYPPQPMGPPPLGGLLIFVSIVNIAACLFCGCTDFSMGSTFTALRDPAQRQEFVQQFRSERENALQEAEDEASRQAMTKIFDGIDDFVQEIERDPSIAKRMALLHWGELGAKVLLLIGTALMLARVGIGRPLSILSLLGWIAINVAWGYSATQSIPGEEIQAAALGISAVSLAWPIIALCAILFFKPRHKMPGNAY